MRSIAVQRIKTAVTIFNLKNGPFPTTIPVPPSGAISRPGTAIYSRPQVFHQDYKAISYRNLSVIMQSSPGIIFYYKNITNHKTSTTMKYIDEHKII